MPDDIGRRWQMRTLGSLFSRLVNGGTPDTGNPSYWNGATPWVTGADFNSTGLGEIRRYVSENGVRASSTNVVGAGNLLVVTRTGVGKLAIAPFDVAVSQDITGVYVDQSVADVKFVYFLLVRELDELRKLNQGTSINGIIRSDFEKHEVAIPRSIEEQRKIAAVFTSIDTAIEKTEALIEKYQQIKSGVMHDLFTRGVLPNGQLRPHREQAPELYQETAIGWIPATSTIKYLSEVADVIDPQPDHRTPPESTDGIAYVGIGDFDRYQELALTSCRKIIHDAYEKQQRRFSVEEGDVIFGKIGTIGQAKRLPFGGYAVSANVILFKPRIDTYYFYYAVSSSSFDKQVANITNTTSQPALGIERVRCLRIPVPNNEETILIGASIQSVARLIGSETRRLDKLRRQKNGLMQDLLTGKVPVKLAAEPVELSGG